MSMVLAPYTKAPSWKFPQSQMEGLMSGAMIEIANFKAEVLGTRYGNANLRGANFCRQIVVCYPELRAEHK
jgi:hypothetical protein